MKTQEIMVTIHRPNWHPGILAPFIAALITFNILPEAWSLDLFWTGTAPNPAAAGSGSWVATPPAVFAWSTTPTAATSTVWTDGSVAHFVGTNGGTATLMSNITAAGINFDPGASAFAIDTNGFMLNVHGAGIVNSSGKTQTINNNGSDTVFTGTSSAGNATINNNAGTAIVDDGSTIFEGSSTAGSATITNNGGTDPGNTLFFGNSDGGTARLITIGNGFVDISRLSRPGMGIGSIEGSGKYLLGSKTLSVGSNNLSTTVSGVIQGIGGSLTKVGMGTLTLTGINTYSGGTNLNGGILAVNSAINLGTGALSFNGGTLEALAGGSGIISGKAITLNGGGGTFLADANTSSTLSGVISGTGHLVKSGAGTLVLSGTNTYTGGTTISAGTLQAGSATGLSANSEFTVNSNLDLNGFNSTIGSLSGTGAVLNSAARTATLTVGNDNNSTTFGGVLEDGAGVLELTKSGTGTLTLSGTNAYSGGTNLNGGILAVSSDVNLGSGALSFNGGTLEALTGGGITSGKSITLNAGGGTFLADANTSSTLSGVITGTGNLVKSGAGTLILSGLNAYSGGTSLNGGILAVSADNSLGTGTLSFNGGALEALAGGGGIISSKSITLNALGGAFLADTNTSSTLSGVISGTGTLFKSGAGTLILTGTNTYIGGTTIRAGTLQIGNGATAGSVTGDVVDNGTLAFDRSDSVTFGGVISGTGSVVKLGTGTLTLPSTNTYTGTTIVDSGSLIVDGSIASAQTVVNSGGFLGGHGTIGGNLVNNGTVSQINSPGILTVAGNYTQNAGGTLRIAVGGLAPSQHDLLAVNGQATIAGKLQLIQLGGFNLQPGNQITFLTAKNGVSGTFSNAQNGLVGTGTLVQAKITSLPNAVVLEGTQGSIANTPGIVQTPNEASVARALDSAAGDPREAALFAFLNSQPLANLPHDLSLIAPTQITSINATAVSVSKVQISNVGQRMANIRGGSTGFSSAGFSISGGAASIGEGFEGVSGPEGKSGPAVFAPTPDNRWGVFVTGIGEFNNVDSTPNAAGYDVNTGGVTFGVDYRLTPNFAIGLTAGYAHTSVGLDGGGNIDVNGGKIGAYATIFWNGFYLDTAASGGPSGYNTHRTALQGTASGSTDGADFDALVAVGYDWKKGNLSIGPTASFQYSYIGLDSFTETGSLAPLKFPDQNTESERTAFGAKASYEWKIGQITVIPQVSAAWQHEFGATAYSVAANFATGAGNSFTVTGPDIGRDSLLVGAGATVILNERVSTYLYYDGEFARTNYLSNNVSAGVRITF